MRRLLGFAIVPVSVGAFLVTPASATVLNFDIDNIVSGQQVSDNYGDRAAGDGVPHADFHYGPLGASNWTPNIELNYSARANAPGQAEVFASLAWHNGAYSSFEVAYAPLNNEIAEISFIPDPGYAVRINAFDLAAWSGFAYQNDLIRITDVTRTLTLWSPPDDAPDPNPTSPGSTMIGPATETLTPAYTGAPGDTIRLQFGYNWNVAIDNVSFDQIIPEPASAPLLAGLATLLARRRRHA
jgi:hypothetical protein